MGGPAASVFLSQPLSSSEKEQLRALCATLGDNLEIEEGDFRFNMRSPASLGADWPFEPEYHPPISLHFQDLDVEHSPEDLEQIIQVTGFPVQEQLLIIAHTNGRTSHHALGALTLHLARKYQGLIDLGGALDDDQYMVWHQGARDQEMEQAIQMYEAYFEGHPGRLWAVPYNMSEGERWFGHFCDIQFMAWWLKHPHFYMVK